MTWQNLRDCTIRFEHEPDLIMSIDWGNGSIERYGTKVIRFENRPWQRITETRMSGEIICRMGAFFAGVDYAEIPGRELEKSQASSRGIPAEGTLREVEETMDIGEEIRRFTVVPVVNPDPAAKPSERLDKKSARTREPESNEAS